MTDLSDMPGFTDQTAEFLKVAANSDYEIKKAISVWIFHHLLAHAREGGSYRGLIYERLGFGGEAYRDLIDGLELSNMFSDLEQLAVVKKEVRENRISSLKTALALCDVDGCFEDSMVFGHGRRTCKIHNHNAA